MSVPSYGDLTPGIPGVIDSEAAGNLASLLRELPAAGVQHPACSSPPAASAAAPAAKPAEVYACLRFTAGGGQLEAVLAVARDFSPRLHQASECEMLLDVSGLGRLIGPPREIERQLARALSDAGVAASVAIGSTQTIARLRAHATANGPALGHKGHPEHEDHETTGCDLCDRRGPCAGGCGRGSWLQLPVELLQPLEMLPPATSDRDRARPYETLERWGIATLGELAALPAAALSSRLGRRGMALQRLARGLDARPFAPDRDTPRYIGRLELEWPIEALEPLSFVFARLLEPLATALDRAARAAAAVRLDLRLTDRSTQTRVLQLPAPIGDPRVLRTLLLLDLESGSLLRRGRDGASDVMVDVVTIELDPAPSRVTQFSLLRRPLPSPEMLSTLIARLSALCGETRVGAAALLDSHRPDGFAMGWYLPPEVANGAVESAAGAASAVLRRERRSVALSVSLERGRPVHVAASRRGVPYGAIVQAAGPWRTSGEWWSDRSWNHNEWDVALKSGAVCRIYQDRTTERWFFEGIYD